MPGIAYIIHLQGGIKHWRIAWALYFSERRLLNEWDLSRLIYQVPYNGESKLHCAVPEERIDPDFESSSYSLNSLRPLSK